ncbi:MAG: type II 3-dehydroquinate dehydratase [Maricaulis sp.]|nr:type II 3-dehydroquinate dehydratase [Maricaulis sp.]HAQ34387.1 type II 3-dehydroquinate dehydratase [Alphaproteobacteria bacterium]
MRKPVYILNGPNLNLLGRREPHIYGTQTLKNVESMCEAKAAALGLTIDFRQTNHEGELIDWVQEAMDSAAALILNAAGYTHTSVALHDALKALSIPIIEVHLSDPAQRESFRHISFVGMAATQSIAGLGARGYELALESAASLV